MVVHLESRSIRRGRNNMANAKARKKSSKIKRQQEDAAEAKKLGISVDELLTKRAQEGFKIIEAAREEEKRKLKNVAAQISRNSDDTGEDRRSRQSSIRSSFIPSIYY
jgi:hypothetical protein